MTTLELILLLLFIDSLGAVLVSWCGPKWYLRTFAPISRWFPPAKGWALYYLVLVVLFAFLTGVVAL